MNKLTKEQIKALKAWLKEWARAEDSNDQLVQDAQYDLDIRECDNHVYEIVKEWQRAH